MIFTGVGLGVAASGTLVPLLLRAGLVAAWCGLGVVSAALTLLAWNGWPRAVVHQEAAPAARRVRGVLVWALLAEYGLNAVGLVPHMVFLVDFVARGLGAGIAAGGFYWVVFGLGAMVGPLLTGALGDRIGRLLFTVGAAALGLALAIDLLVRGQSAAAETPPIRASSA